MQDARSIPRLRRLADARDAVWPDTTIVRRLYVQEHQNRYPAKTYIHVFECSAPEPDGPLPTECSLSRQNCANDWKASQADNLQIILSAQIPRLSGKLSNQRGTIDCETAPCVRRFQTDPPQLKRHRSAQKASFGSSEYVNLNFQGSRQNGLSVTVGRHGVAGGVVFMASHSQSPMIFVQKQPNKQTNHLEVPHRLAGVNTGKHN